MTDQLCISSEPHANNALPWDLILIIAEYSDYSTVKSLRLTCRAANDCVKPIFASRAYAELYCTLETSSIDRLQSICTTSWIARHVKTVSVWPGTQNDRGDHDHAKMMERCFLPTFKTIFQTLKREGNFGAVVQYKEGFTKAERTRHPALTGYRRAKYTWRPQNLLRNVLGAMYQSEYPAEELHLLIGQDDLCCWESAPPVLVTHLGNSVKELTFDFDRFHKNTPYILRNFRGWLNDPAKRRDLHCFQNLNLQTFYIQLIRRATHLESFQITGSEIGLRFWQIEAILHYLPKANLREVDFPIEKMKNSRFSDFQTGTTGSVLKDHYFDLAFEPEDYPKRPRITISSELGTTHL